MCKSKVSITLIIAASCYAALSLAANRVSADVTLPTPLAVYKAANYNATTGVWADSSGNGDDATVVTSTNPTVTTGATPNGSSVVTFDGTQGLALDSMLHSSTGFTIFAYLRVSTTSAASGIVGSESAGLDWRIYGGVQQLLLTNVAGEGNSNTAIPTTSFSNINVAADPNGYLFRYNGAVDGFGNTDNVDYNYNGIQYLGYSAQYSPAAAPIVRYDLFNGDIAEVRVYGGVLSEAQRQAVEGAFAQSYVATAPEPASAALLLVGLGGLALLGGRSRQPRHREV